MDTKSKFLRFGFGFLLGIFLLLIMFGNRDFSCVRNYFPQGRVLENIKKKELVFSTKIPAEYKKITDTTYFKEVFLKYATVNFDKSNPQKKPCGEYLISNDTLTLLIKNCYDKAEIVDIDY
ncbi:MAG: hypothetical protein ACK5MD_03915 [Flavobacteriales bacterium]